MTVQNNQNLVDVNSQKKQSNDVVRQFILEGRYREAADVLVKLSTESTPSDCVKLLCQAAMLLRAFDHTRAIKLSKAATQIESDLALPWITLAYVYFEIKNNVESKKAALQAITKKINADQLVDIGRHLSILGEDEKAIESVTRGYEFSGRAVRLASYSLRVALQSADWKLSSAIIEQLKNLYKDGKIKESGETPRTHLLWCADEATNIKVISAFAEKGYAVKPPMVTTPYAYKSDRKLKIGYISSDYRDHATSLLALGLLRHHDREKFELYGYCTSYDDGSALRRDMLGRFDHARVLNKLTDISAAQLIKKDQIDILIDLNGLTDGSRPGVLAFHPAPIQISYLGFPGTSGGRFIDYIIADDYTIPQGAEDIYPEKIIRIPDTYQINDYLARYLPLPTKRSLIEIPEGKLIIGMFNNVNKVHLEVWETWMKLLNKVTNAVFWMLDPGPVARKNLLASAQDLGVTGDRIYFAPKKKQEPHIARIQWCDIVVDPWPYGGHTTTGDALFAGVPVVALEGSNFASRVSGGLIKAARLERLVAKSKDEYVDIAAQLLMQPDEILKIKIALKNERQNLEVFNSPMRVKCIESAYLTLYENAIKGLPKAHLTIDKNNIRD